MSRCRESARVDRYAAGAAGVLVAAGLVIRLSGISEYWLNPDEGIYYSTLTRPGFGEFWADVMANAHPPVFYLLLRAAGTVTWDFVWMRGLSVLFGAAAIWLFFLVGREIGGRGLPGALAGLAAAALWAFNDQAITLSMVMRPYTLLVLLLTGTLYFLLRYRLDPSRRNLTCYIVLLCLALATHYSAVLAVVGLAALVAHDRWTGELDVGAWRRLSIAHATPAALLAVLVVGHLRVLMGSPLAADTLGPDGWLTGWLISSPGEAWASVRDFQLMLGPAGLQARSALLLLSAIALSVAVRDRVVAVLAGTALATAVGAAAVGAYPLGPSRHSAWLVVFTLPALAWLVGALVPTSRRTALTAGAVLILFMAFGAPLERALTGRGGAPPDPRTSATEELILRHDDLAPLVVERLDREAGPRLILMTEQTYNLLAPFYTSDRNELTWSADSTLMHFRYGSRDVVVARTWDWEPPLDVAAVAVSLGDKLPELHTDEESTALLLAGGWGSVFFLLAPDLRERGVILDESVALGRDPAGGPVVRLLAAILDWKALRD